jgi:N-acyl amino acid synthase of PEP-CTERM/exosortase system
MLETVFALRYKVYCIDCGFLPAKQYPDGLEHDEFDRHSSHFCAIDRHKQVVGAVRLVRPPVTKQFPYQEKCGRIFDDVILPPRERCAEISRLVVDRNYHRRAGELPEGICVTYVEDRPPPAGVERRANRPEIVLGLYRALYQHSRREGIHYWYAAMERTLARALQRFHFEFEPIGPEGDYFGPVAPYLASLDDLERSVGQHNEALLRWFQED